MATEKPKSIRDLWVKPMQKDNTRFSGSKQTHSFRDNRGRGKRDADGLWWEAPPPLVCQTLTKIGIEHNGHQGNHTKESVEDRQCVISTVPSPTDLGVLRRPLSTL